MEFDRVEKPLRKLRKLLKDLPQNPPPEQVHKLRTQTRRIEAVASALEPAAEKKTKRLLKLLKPVRKAAGGVRDMDVLTADLLHLQRNTNRDSILRLVEHLATERNKNADNLLETVSEQRRPARRHLKEYAAVIESVAVGKKPVRREIAHTLDSQNGQGSHAETLMQELNRWPTLNSQNLHDFRLKIKQLRYVLQMFPESDPRLVNALGTVKDQIGEWHDWLQLSEISQKILDPQNDRELIAQIENAGKQKLTRALETSNSFRSRFLSSRPVKRRRADAS